MKTLILLTKRNIKLFFRDKGMFFSSLITPIILLVLYATFLAKVYRDSITSGMGEMSNMVSTKLLDSFVACQLISSLLAVSAVTVSFCSNLIMIQDKVTKAKTDFDTSPVKKSTIALSYYFSTVIISMLICLATLTIGFIYIAIMGWYISVSDVLIIILDLFLLVLFGTAFSSIICYPLKTQGAMSAVGTIISSGYGFICGAYMPISQFGSFLQNILAFLPGTYGTSIIRNHMMQGVLKEMTNNKIPSMVIENIGKSIDLNPTFFSKPVPIYMMYIILISSILILTSLYVLINYLNFRKTKANKKEEN